MTLALGALEAHTNKDTTQDYDKVAEAMRRFSARLDAVEAHGGQGGLPSSGAGKGYLPEKSLIPKTYQGELDGWRSWRDDLTEFMDNKNPGMKRFLEEVSNKRDELVSDVMLQKWNVLGNKVVGDQVQVWRTLKALTSGVARTVVMGVGDEDGFEAWRRLHVQLEPKLVIRQGQVLSDFVSMVSKPAKTIGETRDLITEMERKLKVIRDLTREGVSDIHAKSVLTGIIDPMTRQHMTMNATDGYDEFRRKVIEFTDADRAGHTSKYR